MKKNKTDKIETSETEEAKAENLTENGIEDIFTEKLANLEKELNEAKDDAARARADFYNFRSRIEKNRARDRQLAAEKSVDLLLPVYENLERACESIEDKEGNVYKGISMVTKQFFSSLEELGIEEISTEGDFNPAVHEAVAMEPTNEEANDGKIVTVFRKGYTLAGRVLRAAQVKVSNYEK